MSAYRRRDADPPRHRPTPITITHAPMSRAQFAHVVIRGECQSDIAYDPHVLDPREAHGGRLRLPNPRALAPMHTVVTRASA